MRMHACVCILHLHVPSSIQHDTKLTRATDLTENQTLWNCTGMGNISDHHLQHHHCYNHYHCANTITRVPCAWFYPFSFSFCCYSIVVCLCVICFSFLLLFVVSVCEWGFFWVFWGVTLRADAFCLHKRSWSVTAGQQLSTQGWYIRSISMP